MEIQKECVASNPKNKIIPQHTHTDGGGRERESESALNRTLWYLWLLKQLP